MRSDLPDEAEHFFTVDEIANRHKRSKRSILRAIESKELIAHRFGSSIRISVGDLKKYEATQREKQR